MQWKEFKESAKEYPDQIIEKAISGFSKATGDLVDLILYKANDTQRLKSHLDSSFQYFLDLRSKHIPSYSFTVLQAGYDIELFPVKLSIEESIHENIFSERKSYVRHLELKDEKELNTLLKSIFDSSRFEEIVSGLMKVARRSRDEKKSPFEY